MKMTRATRIVFVFICLAISGCQHLFEKRKQEIVQEADRPLTLIEQYAASAARSLEALADIDRRARNVENTTGAAELDYAFDMAFNGTVEEAVKYVVSHNPYMSDWHVTTPQFAPSSPVMVSVYGRKLSTFGYLRNIGAQVGARAIIAIDVDEKKIHISYGVRGEGK